MKNSTTAALRLSFTLFVVVIGSGCRGMRARELQRRIDQLENRNTQLESRVSNLEERLEVRVVPVTDAHQPGGN